MDPHHVEGMVRHKTSLSQLREAINKSPSFEVAFRDSMSPLMACLAGRFCNMKLKEEHITCTCGAGE